MRTLRLSLVGMAIIALLTGSSAAVMAQDAAPVGRRGTVHPLGHHHLHGG